MPISILATLSYLLFIGSACAQTGVSVPNCTDSTLDWSFNSLQQSPCFVAASLEAVCFGSFALSALSPGQIYTGPNVTTTDGDLCNCNTVVYSLMSACAACQQGEWISYSSWLNNCSNSTTGVFPMLVPVGIRVPHWAYLTSFTVESNDSWNLTAAEAAGDTPEVTWRATVTTGGTSTTFSSTASGSGSSLTFSPTPSGSHPSSTSISHTSPNRGRMEGGTIGGVVGATLIGVVVWFVRRRRARRAPSITDTRGEMEQPVPYPPAIKMPKLYDPSDPTTYPRIKDLPTVGNQHLGPFSSLQPSRHDPTRYGGLPEV